MKKLEIPMLLPGIRLNTSPTDYFPIKAEQLARFETDHWVLFGELQSRDVA
jgi:branched-chain amino acid transport system substrate-binding protein